MKISSRDWTRLFCIVLCISLLLPSGLTSQVVADTGADVHTSVRDDAQIQGKISERLTEHFQEDETATFLVKLSEQADTEQVARQAAEEASAQNATAFQTQYRQRSAVANELRAVAQEAQADVVSFLDKLREDGQVEDYHSYYIVNGIAVTATEETAEQLAAFPEVEKILPNEERKLLPVLGEDLENAVNKLEASKNEASKNEASKNRQHTKTADSKTTAVEWNIEAVDAPQAWEMGVDGSGIVIANIDTGVQWDHPALIEQYRGYNVQDPDNSQHELNWFDAVNGESEPYDDNGHGTHVTGTSVGAEPDGSNLIGVAPGAEWIAVKAFTGGGGATDADLLAAGEWILAPTDEDGNPRPDKAPHIVNNSWGGGPGIDEWYRPMVQNWRAAEIVPVFAAGNVTLGNPGGPGSVSTPANYPESFAVGATDSNNMLAGFSLRGPSPYDEIKPEVSAPGVSIRSAVPGNGYSGAYSGTSMAAPHTSGLAALLLQENASLSVDELEQIMMDTATPRTDDEYADVPNNGYGHGIINALDAVSAVRDGVGQISGYVLQDGEDTEPPTYAHEPVTEVFDGIDVPLIVEVQDNVSVTHVTLEYRGDTEDEWQELEAELIAGDFRHGTYQAVIPGEDVREPALSYRWRMTDFGENEVISDSYDVEVLSGITIGYEQDFESYPTGWYSYGENDSWEWGIPTSGPEEAAVGENVYATNLSGDYDNNADMSLMMPPIDLPEGESYLQFQHWYNLERNYDFGHIFVSTDGEEWEDLATVNDISDGWEEAEVELSAYAGERVYIQFHVQSDFSIIRPGWYIDDVKLTDTALGSSNAQLGVKPVREKPSAAKADEEADVSGGKSEESAVAEATSAAKQKEQNKQEKKDKNKKNVDPHSIQPGEKQQIRLPAHTEQADHTDHSEPAPLQLPLEATVSVLETGRSVQTDPADGSFQMTHVSGTYTLVAESYGFRSADQTVDVPADGEVEATFVLEAIEQGTVSGTVTNAQTGLPVENATLMLMEDASVEPVQTDADGQYSLSAYEGTYTLRIMAHGYYSESTEITVEGNETTQQDVELEPFIGFPGEIGYDDGSAENARAFFDAGNGWAVRMSLDEGQDRAMVTGGLFHFWDTSWPVPGGEDFQVAVYDASGSDGAPGEQLAGPIDATANRDGSWTEVDLSGEGIIVDGDFYLVYLQTDPHPNAPGLATDENGPFSGRGWQYEGGSWSETQQSEGNYMIRALVDYEITAPVITSPPDGLHTNEEVLTVEGESTPTTEITLFNHNQEVGSVETSEEGTFSVDIELEDGENILTAAASTERGMTEPSEPITVVLDQTRPELVIDSPADGWKTNREAVTVEGTATDDHLDRVRINGQNAAVDEDGTFSHRMLLENGENEILVVAIDKAGNRTREEITVYAKFDAPIVENLLPDEDKHLNAGESVKIEFNSEAGLDATFVIHMPLVNPMSNSISSATELPMREVEEGHYVGYYTATSNVVAEGAEIEVIARDDFGNETRKKAEGNLYINVE